VPGDLPVFLKLALMVLRKQDPANRVETLVIPDISTSTIRQIVSEEQKTWPGDLQLVEMPWPDRFIPAYINRPHHNHWLQFINGIRKARATHVLLHDADLFLTIPDIHKQQYELAVDGQFACFGVSQVWDHWYEKQGKYLTATWEMLCEVEWARSFAPYLHLGHDAKLNGMHHTFDTTLYPQCLTEPNRIGWHTPASGFVHFNYVVCTFRYFFNHYYGFEDEHFRLLLIRILVDSIGRRVEPDRLPDALSLEEGMFDELAPVTYLNDTSRANYLEFRNKIQIILDSQLFDATQAKYVREILQPFDKNFSPSEEPIVNR